MHRDIQIFTILTGIVLGIVFSPVVLSKFINTGTDLTHIYPGVLQQMPIWPQAWESWWSGADLGHAQWSVLWLTPVWSAYSLLGRLGLSWELLVKLSVFLFLLLGSWGWWKWGELDKWSLWARWVAAVLYFVNTYFLVVLDGGSLFIAGAYSCMPFLLWLTGHVSRDPVWWNQILLGVVVGLVGLLDIRIITIYALIVVLGLISHIWLPRVIPGMLIMIAVIHSFWWIPALANRWYGQSIEASPRQVDQFSFLSPAHLLFVSQPHWYNNLFGDIQPVRGEMVFWPVLVVISILFIRARSKRFFLILAILGLLLAKGQLPPGENLYGMVLGWLPGFAGFRDPSKFEILRNLGFTGLIALLINHLNNKKLAILVAALSVVTVYPAYTGKMTGMFSAPPDVDLYQRQADFLRSQPGTFRVLWVPTKPPLGYASQNAIWTEGISLLKKKPFRDAVDGTYEYLNYLRSPQAPFLLRNIGVKYIVYPYPEDRKKRLHPDEVEYYAWFRGWFASQSWLKDVSLGPRLGMFEVLDTQPLNFVKFSPTRYMVDVSVVPQQIIFPESFDSGWRLGGKKSEIALDMLNSFYVDKPGKYILEFIPQKNLDLALSFSILATITVVLISYARQRILQHR